VKVVHFHSGDPRFCGSREQYRAFTLTDADVTCAACLGSVAAFINSVETIKQVQPQPVSVEA
jgi:precorrin-4 methylase